MLETEGAGLKKRLAILAAAIFVALPLTMLTPSPASACTRYPCYTTCHFRDDFLVVNEDGSVSSSGRVMECYY